LLRDRDYPLYVAHRDNATGRSIHLEGASEGILSLPTGIAQLKHPVNHPGRFDLSRLAAR
jgi:hypothetical protein